MSVITVTGPIEAGDLGITDIHEHILCDFSRNYEYDPLHPERKYSVVSFETIGTVNHNPLSIPDNLVLASESLAIQELTAYREAGGQTIVDLTTRELGRNPLALRRIAEQTGLHVVVCTGHYTRAYLPSSHATITVEEMVDNMTAEITEGIDGTGVRAGIIGELGTSDRIYPEEAKGLRAAARVNRALGAPVMVHTEPRSCRALEALEILRSEGADLRKVSICHMDSAFLEDSYFEAILATGAWIELDTFGENFCLHPNYGPSDLDRIKLLTRLIERGYTRQIMLGSDVCLKCRLHAYGGWGYDHLLTNVVPAMNRHGITHEHLNTLMVTNPKGYLDF